MFLFSAERTAQNVRLHGTPFGTDRQAKGYIVEETHFVVTLPLFMVVDVSKGIIPLECVCIDDEAIRGIAIFTEEVHAERARDSQSPNADIWKIPTSDHFGFHIRSMRNGGIRYVAIDPYEESGRKTRFLSLEEFERAYGR